MWEVISAFLIYFGISLNQMAFLMTISLRWHLIFMRILNTGIQWLTLLTEFWVYLRLENIYVRCIMYEEEDDPTVFVNICSSISEKSVEDAFKSFWMKAIL